MKSLLPAPYTHPNTRALNACLRVMRREWWSVERAWPLDWNDIYRIFSGVRTEALVAALEQSTSEFKRSALAAAIGARAWANWDKFEDFDYAVPVLLPLLDDPRWGVSDFAETALWWIDPHYNLYLVWDALLEVLAWWEQQEVQLSLF